MNMTDMFLIAIALILQIFICSVTGDLPYILRPYNPPNSGGKCQGLSAKAHLNTEKLISPLNKDLAVFYMHFEGEDSRGEKVVLGNNTRGYFDMSNGRYAELDFHDMIINLPSVVNEGWFKLNLRISMDFDPFMLFPLVETRLMGGYNWTKRDSICYTKNNPTELYEFWFYVKKDQNPIFVAGTAKEYTGERSTYRFLGVYETGLGYGKEYNDAHDMKIFIRNWNSYSPEKNVSYVLHVSVDLERMIPFWQDYYLFPGPGSCTECEEFNRTQTAYIKAGFNKFANRTKHDTFMARLHPDYTDIRQAYEDYGWTGEQLKSAFATMMAIMQGVNMKFEGSLKYKYAPPPAFRKPEIVSGCNVVMIKSSKIKSSKIAYCTSCGALGVFKLCCNCTDDTRAHFQLHSNPTVIEWEVWHFEQPECFYTEETLELEILKQYMYRAFDSENIAQTDIIVSKMHEIYKETFGLLK